MIQAQFQVLHMLLHFQPPQEPYKITGLGGGVGGDFMEEKDFRERRDSKGWTQRRTGHPDRKNVSKCRHINVFS